MAEESEVREEVGEKAPAAWWLLVIGGLQVVFAMLVEMQHFERTVLIVVAAMLGLLALAMLLSTRQMTLDLVSRRFTYRRNRLPWGRRLEGDMDTGLRGLVTGPKPCGRRRGCIAEFGVWIDFDTDEEGLQLSHWASRESAEQEARERAAAWRLPLYDDEALLLYQPEDEAADASR